MAKATITKSTIYTPFHIMPYLKINHESDIGSKNYGHLYEQWIVEAMLSIRLSYKGEEAETHISKLQEANYENVKKYNIQYFSLLADTNKYHSLSLPTKDLMAQALFSEARKKVSNILFEKRLCSLEDRSLELVAKLFNRANAELDLHDEKPIALPLAINIAKSLLVSKTGHQRRLLQIAESAKVMNALKENKDSQDAIATQTILDVKLV